MASTKEALLVFWFHFCWRKCLWGQNKDVFTLMENLLTHFTYLPTHMFPWETVTLWVDMISGQWRSTRYCTRMLSTMYQTVDENIMRQRLFQSGALIRLLVHVRGKQMVEVGRGWRDNRRISRHASPFKPPPPSRPPTSLFHVFQNNAIFMLRSSAHT